MSIFDGTDNLNAIDPATPLDGCTPYELLQAVREMKMVLKNILLQSHLPDGRLRTDSLTNLADNVVGNSQVVDLSLTGAKLVDSTITAEKLLDGSVTETKIADGAVVEAKYGAGSIPATAFKANTIPLTALADFITSEFLSQSPTDNALRAITENTIADEAVVDRAIKDMALTKLTGGSDYNMMLKLAGSWAAIPIVGALTYNSISGEFELDSGLKAATFGDTKARGSSGGVATAASWNTREIGEITDPSNLTTIASNRVSLIKGKYLIYFSCPASGIGKHQARLLDYTNTLPVIWGTSEQSPASGTQSRSIVCGVFEVTNPTDEYTVEHYIQNTVGSSDLGVAASSDNSIPYGSHSENFTYGFVVKIG